MEGSLSAGEVAKTQGGAIKKRSPVANDYLSQKRVFCCRMRNFVGRFTRDNYTGLGNPE